MSDFYETVACTLHVAVGDEDDEAAEAEVQSKMDRLVRYARRLGFATFIEENRDAPEEGTTPR